MLSHGAAANMTDQSHVNKLLAELRKSYIAELDSKCDGIEQRIMTLKVDDNFAENYDELFRHVHSLKGSAGAYGLPIITTICHRLEDHLRLVDGKVEKRRGKDLDNWLAHVDLLRSAATAAVTNQDNSREIEAQLDQIQDDALKQVLRALLVEPARSTSRMCALLLDESGYKVTTTQSGVEALQLALTDPYSVIVTSMELQKLNGLALLAALRLSHSTNAHAPFIMLTSQLHAEVSPLFHPVIIIHKGPGFAGQFSRELTQLTR